MIDHSQLRSLTARQLRRVTVPFTRTGDTFAPKTLKTIIEDQARWTADDLHRLELLK